jgi:hypothetical protein
MYLYAVITLEEAIFVAAYLQVLKRIIASLTQLSFNRLLAFHQPFLYLFNLQGADLLGE